MVNQTIAYHDYVITAYHSSRCYARLFVLLSPERDLAIGKQLLGAAIAIAQEDKAKRTILLTPNPYHQSSN